MEKVPDGHHDSELQGEVGSQRHNFEKLLALRPMIDSGGEWHIKDKSAGDVIGGEKTFGNEMVAAKVPTSSAGDAFGIGEDSRFGLDL